jgi:hypothetical protein
LAEEEEEEAIADIKARRQHGAWANEAGVREESVRRAWRAAGPAMALASTDMADEDEDEDGGGAGSEQGAALKRLLARPRGAVARLGVNKRTDVSDAVQSPRALFTR